MAPDSEYSYTNYPRQILSQIPSWERRLPRHGRDERKRREDVMIGRREVPAGLPSRTRGSSRRLSCKGQGACRKARQEWGGGPQVCQFLFVLGSPAGKEEGEKQEHSRW